MRSARTIRPSILPRRNARLLLRAGASAMATRDATTMVSATAAESTAVSATCAACAPGTMAKTSSLSATRWPPARTLEAQVDRGGMIRPITATGACRQDSVAMSESAESLRAAHPERDHPLASTMSVREGRDTYLAENGFLLATY